MNLPRTEDEDTLHLRQRFVENIAEGEEEPLAFLPLEENEGDIKEKAIEFRTPGVYDKTLGDLMMKAFAEVLQITIIVITSNESVPWLSFVPDKFSSEESIFVAFHFYGAGHYDSTRRVDEGKPSNNIY